MMRYQLYNYLKALYSKKGLNAIKNYLKWLESQLTKKANQDLSLLQNLETKIKITKDFINDPEPIKTTPQQKENELINKFIYLYQHKRIELEDIKSEYIRNKVADAVIWF